MNPRKTLELILRGSRNVRFADFVRLVEAINLQDYHGTAKPYQIRQFLKLVEQYGLKLEERT